MSNDDPFAIDDDKTVLQVPDPGGRGRVPPRAAPSGSPGQGSKPVGDASAVAAELRRSGMTNPLVGCATALLELAGQLRNTPTHPNPDGLLRQLIGEVRDFTQCARGQGRPDQVVLPARYVLCALLDETVMSTPWGHDSSWSTQGLLIAFHKEAWGGEKFFVALDRLIAYPAGNLELLELLYFCLAFGFEGRYAERPGGRDELQLVRERLYQTIRGQRGEAESELSPHWRGVTERRDPLIQYIPLWVLSAISAALLLGLFTFLLFRLHDASDSVYADLAGLKKDLPPIARRALELPPDLYPPERPLPIVVKESPTLHRLLRAQIDAGSLQVDDRPPGAETVFIRDVALFHSGKATLRPELEPLLTAIGQALSRLEGEIQVTGHTDAVPVRRSLAFPSNQALSEARARNVAERLKTITGQPDRFRSPVGRGATEPLILDAHPLDPLDARNRRVEITWHGVR